MADQKMIQRCQLSSAANCFLNSHRESGDAEPVSMNDPTAPYYDGHNWKSAMSVSNELDRHTHSVVKDYWRIRAQMDDSLNRLDLGYEKAKKVDRLPKTRDLVQRGSAKAIGFPAHLQTPFVLNPTSNRISEWPSRFENSHLSEHTGSLGLPVNHDDEDTNQSGLYLESIRASAISNGRKDQQYSPQLYHNYLLGHNQDSNMPLLGSMALYFVVKLPQTMRRIGNNIFNGTEEEKMKAKNKLSRLQNIFRRNQLKRKPMITADRGAKKAQEEANIYRSFKKSKSLSEQMDQFECIKRRGGAGYLEINHHLSAVPGYMNSEVFHERLPCTGLWNAIGPGNGVKRERRGSVWRTHDPHGVHSSLRMVSNASSDFQEEYITKATYPLPTSIHTVDGGSERMREESIPKDEDSDETDADEKSPNQIFQVDISSDDTCIETDNDEWETEDERTED